VSDWKNNRNASYSTDQTTSQTKCLKKLKTLQNMYNKESKKRMDIHKLYEIAQDHNIEIISFDLPLVCSMSHMTSNLDCYIGIDYNQIESQREERTIIAHEIGHCIQGAFYNRYSSVDIKSKHEYRADKWAVETLIPFDEILEALTKGYEQVLELPELLKQLPRTSEFVFPNIKGIGCQLPCAWSNKLRRHMKKIKGVPPLSAHEIRHTYGTELRRRGVDIYTIQKIMGHKDIRMTTEIYVHNEFEILKKALLNK